jgi:hypothetical protein
MHLIAQKIISVVSVDFYKRLVIPVSPDLLLLIETFKEKIEISIPP